MKIWFLLFFPGFLLAQPCKKWYKDKLETDSKLVSCDPMYTFEKMKSGTYVLKVYYPETRVIIQRKTFLDKDKNTLHGPYHEYWDDGTTIFNQGNYVHGKKEGEWIENSYQKGSYKNGEKQGTWKYFRKNGSLRFEKTFADGKQHGPARQYNEEGLLIKEDLYEEGNRVSASTDSIREIPQTMPRYPGCENPNETEEEKNECSGKNMLTDLYSKMRYPFSAREHGYYGRALIQFVVNKDGEIEEVEVINGICEDIKKEVFNLVSSMPRWIPGTQDGKPVKVSYTLPIQFRLE